MFLILCKLCAILFLFILLISFVGILMKNVMTYMENNPHACESIIRVFVFAMLLCNCYFLACSYTLFLSNAITQMLCLLLFDDYPNISAYDMKFIAAIVISAFNHLYLTSIARKAVIYGLGIALCYFIIWATPLTLCFCISSNQDTVSLDCKTRKISRTIKRAIEWIQKTRTIKSNNKES